ncbi:MAG: capsule assembly Wzi family protein [Bryobacterales bacterium]|nr:capsule assembly Wzi family protein [Bryobacterales bacterium]
MDSWIYPALDQLSAMGFLRSQVAGIRPWTRRECARQLQEAEARFAQREDTAAAAAAPILKALRREFGPDAEDPALVVESMYTRAGVIAGDYLNDSYHFGQTWRNDMGRPFGRGFNAISGFTARAGRGRFFGYVRGEFQRAPGLEPYSADISNALAWIDRIPEPPARDTAAVDRMRAVEAYVGVRLRGVRIAAGKQTLFWGPAEQAPLSFSTNAEPTYNLKITPDGYRFRGWLRRLGTVRTEFAVGSLGGHRYTSGPWFNAQKVSFKLTEDLEMGFTRWSLLFGESHPITARAVYRNFFSFTSPDSPTRFDRNDPGDRKGGFDFRLRLPGPLRDWLTLYSDSYADDDPSPLAAPRRAAISPGIWLNRVPWIPKLDLRVEAASTQPLGATDLGGLFNYYNAQYRSGNTNYGYLLGNPVGRDGRALEARATYKLSPRDRVEASYRQQTISSVFLPGGGRQVSGALAATLQVGESMWASTHVQYEQFRIPLLTGGSYRNNWSGWVQLTWQPGRQFLRALK